MQRKKAGETCLNSPATFFRGQKFTKVGLWREGFSFFSAVVRKWNLRKVTKPVFLCLPSCFACFLSSDYELLAELSARWDHGGVWGMLEAAALECPAYRHFPQPQWEQWGVSSITLSKAAWYCSSSWAGSCWIILAGSDFLPLYLVLHFLIMER